MAKKKYTFQGKRYWLPALCEMEEKLGIAGRQWEGQCYGISCALLKAGLLHGMPRYGLYRGPVERGSRFYKRYVDTGIVRHGWIEADTLIIDPTRWVFIHSSPFIFTGNKDEFRPEYDVGANQLRKVFMRPPPAYNEFATRIVVAPNDLIPKLSLLGLNMPEGNVTVQQLGWAASLPLEDLGDEAEDLFTWLQQNEMRALVPYDNWQLVMGEG